MKWRDVLEIIVLSWYVLKGMSENIRNINQDNFVFLQK